MVEFDGMEEFLKLQLGSLYFWWKIWIDGGENESVRDEYDKVMVEEMI